MEAQNQYLDYLIDPSFQWVNRLFVLSFEHDAQGRSHKRYFFQQQKWKTTILWLMDNFFLSNN